MEFPRIRLDIASRVATLTLNHPEVLNATSQEMLASLGAALIAQLCIKLRECCQLQDAGTAQMLVAQVRAAFEALRGRLDEYLAAEAAAGGGGSGAA